jgi:hypothetical protein
MNPVHQMRSLPVSSLPISARVDFLHFLACNKPAVRTKLFHTYAKSHLEDWCNSYGFILRIDSESFVCVARDTKVAECILDLDQSHEPHEQLLGLLLGYPECCSDFIASIGESSIDDIEQRITQWNFVGNFKRIDPSNYLAGTSLICHIPCSSSCQPSLDLANQALDFISRYRDESCLAPWLIWVD